MLLGLLGVALVAVVTVEVFYTTLTMRGAGPITDRACEAVWRLMLRLHRRSPRHRVLGLTGAAIAAGAVLAWVLLLWLGWSLIFMAGPEAVLNGRTGEPAGAWDRIYYAGFSVFSLGVGDYEPSGTAWQIATVLATVSGLGVFTVSITYMVPVLSGVTSRRALATEIQALGATAEDIVVGGWNERGFEALERSLGAMTSSIHQEGQRHLAYPVIHYFHSAHRATSLSVRLATLHDALLLLGAGVAASARPQGLRVARNSIGAFLDTLPDGAFGVAKKTPPPPDLQALHRAGIPIDEEGFERAVKDSAERRCRLLAFVERDGWTWDDVRNSGPDPSEPQDP